jgi:hypothetical protein
MNREIEEIKPVQKQSLLKLAEISILLDSYNDIFSDFDPSPYSERTLSDDFIFQAKKFIKDKTANKMSLKLLLPASVRNEQDEKVIIKRLHSHFKDAYQQVESDVKKINRKGILLIVIGIALMITASYLSFMKAEKYHVHFLLVLFEPAGWFLLWAGLDHLVYLSKNTKKDFDFYSKMSKAEIKFLTY